MSLNDPTITATCDHCGKCSEPMSIILLGYSNWDARCALWKLLKQEWTIQEGRTYCGYCTRAYHPTFDRSYEKALATRHGE